MILENPYYDRDVMLARISTCAVTLIWSIVILIVTDGLKPTPYGSYITAVMPENGWALLYGFISMTGLIRIKYKTPPGWVDTLCYIAMLFAWGFIESIVLLVQRPILPTAVCTVSVAFALSVYAFIAAQKHEP